MTNINIFKNKVHLFIKNLFRKNKFHITYYDNGNIHMERHYIRKERKHMLHNDNGPAFIIYYPNGLRKCEHYYLNGNLHNEKGPAYIIYDTNGYSIIEEYYINNILHNENGPSRIWRREHQIMVYYYSLNDVNVTEEIKKLSNIISDKSILNEDIQLLYKLNYGEHITNEIIKLFKNIKEYE